MKKTGFAILALAALFCSCSKTSDTRMAKVKFINAYPSSTYRFTANEKELTPGLIQPNQGSDLIRFSMVPYALRVSTGVTLLSLIPVSNWRLSRITV
jgi:hypothetical protein